MKKIRLETKVEAKIKLYWSIPDEEYEAMSKEDLENLVENALNDWGLISKWKYLDKVWIFELEPVWREE